ncbi:MAG: hypothetical protein E6R05_04690 [Candidatus Moraniibacteriota bacterium]|nr:MAG: hypothetical protein E6R05_04690 [Candidatus Moranbacteria bacterium]
MFKNLFLLVASAGTSYFLSDPGLLPLIALCACGDSGDSGDSSGDTAHGTTPFLCVWNGKRFQFENDVLYGKPTSVFNSPEIGRMYYERGMVTGDLYRIKAPLVPVTGSFRFQIREIEPEESFIDYLALSRVTYPKEGELVTDSNLEDFYVFQQSDIQNRRGVTQQKVVDHNGVDVAKKLNEEEPHIMYPNDEIVVEGKVTGERKSSLPVYFFLGSHYRDWALGEIEIEEGVVSFFRKRMQQVFAEKQSAQKVMIGLGKTLILTLILGTMSLLASSGSRTLSGDANKLSGQEQLAQVFGVPTARADIVGGRSLIVDYFDGLKFCRIDIINPRYFQKCLYAIPLPARAVQADGSIRLKIRATKRHHVTEAFLVTPEKMLPYQVEHLALKKVWHQREQCNYTKELGQRRSGDYLHTIPADVVDVEFHIPSSKKRIEENEDYLFQASGYYTPTSRATQKLAGNWVQKLDPESRAVLDTLYSLRDYDAVDRKSILKKV